MPAFLVAAHVGGDPTALKEALGGGVGETHHHVLAHERVRDAVVMAVPVGVVVDADLCLGPVGVFVPGWRQWLHRRPVDQLEGRESAAGQFFERPAIQIRQEFRDREVQLPQREELAVAKTREYPALYDQHAHLDGRFILRVIGARWKDRGTIVARAVLVGRGRLRLVATGLLDRRFQIVRDPQARHRPEELQHPDCRADPVRQALRPGRLRVRVLRGAQGRHEDLGGEDLAALRVDYRDGVAAVVDEHLLPGAVHLAHRAGQPAAVLVIVQAELAIPVRALPVRLLVFLPQQLQGDSLALELLVDQRIVRLRIAVGWRGFPVHQRLKTGFIELRRQRPRQPLTHRPLHGVRHRALRHPDRRGGFLVTEFRLKFEPQNLFDLAHGTPFGWHGLPPR